MELWIRPRLGFANTHQSVQTQSLWTETAGHGKMPLPLSPPVGSWPFASFHSQKGVCPNHPQLGCPSPPASCPVSGLGSAWPGATDTSLICCHSCEVTYPQPSYTGATLLPCPAHLCRERSRFSLLPPAHSPKPPLAHRAASGLCWELQPVLVRNQLGSCFVFPSSSFFPVSLFLSLLLLMFFDRLLLTVHSVESSLSLDVAAAAVVVKVYYLMGFKP